MKTQLRQVLAQCLRSSFLRYGRYTDTLGSPGKILHTKNTTDKELNVEATRTLEWMAEFSPYTCTSTFVCIYESKSKVKCMKENPLAFTNNAACLLRLNLLPSTGEQKRFWLQQTSNLRNRCSARRWTESREVSTRLWRTAACYLHCENTISWILRPDEQPV